MELKHINLKSKTDVDRARKLYLEAFPKAERAPFRLLTNRAKKGKGDMFDRSIPIISADIKSALSV